VGQPLWIGASVPVGVEALIAFRKLKLGECVLTLLPMKKAEALAVAKYCREHRIHLFFSELLYRGDTEKGLSFAARRHMPRSKFYSKADLNEIIDAAGEYYGGRMTIGESGGLLYWPKSYSINRRAKVFAALLAVRNVADAKAAYIKYLKRFVDYERKELGKGPLLDVDSALVFKYHVEAGIDVLCLESMPGDPHRMHAAIRGAAKAFDKPWGTHVAMACYGGVAFDELWIKRWKSSVYHAALSGAGFIWPESGHYGYDHGSGQCFGFGSPEMKRVRLILREAFQFARVHRRPDSGPKVTLGVVYGNQDGAPGLWNPACWGQTKGSEWLAGPAERSWEFVDKFHRKEDWPKETVQGEMDFSGNPPYGQYDIVPVEASLDKLKSYRCLLFLGWNTMTPAIYAKLKAYVKAGGHLVMFLPHLSTETDRRKGLKLFRSGDFRDLFGVRVLGKGRRDVWGVKCMARSSIPSYHFPLWRIRTDPRFLGLITPSRVKVASARVISGYDDFYDVTAKTLARQAILTEQTLGKGKAFLVSAWQYPGDEGLSRFAEDILRTVLDGEQGDIRLHASDRVRYAVYESRKPKARVVYLLNTDPDVPSPARLWVRGKATEHFTVPANDLRLAYCLDGIVCVPEDKCADLSAARIVRGGRELEFFSARNQNMEIHNLGEKRVKLSVNGVTLTCPPQGCVIVPLSRRADPARKEFFSPGFLSEPAFNYRPGGLPY